jgi:excisionase family DNA binding protein
VTVRQPEHHVLGPGVWVPARVAARLMVDTELQLPRWRRKHRGEDPATDAFMVAMTLVALAHHDQVAASGRAVAPLAATDAPSALTTAEVATQLGCSPRTVRRLASTGVLPSWLIAGRRLFDSGTVEHFRRTGGDPGSPSGPDLWIREAP